jgi:hypothetical protein
MTLANMRDNGVHSLWVVCPLCHHEAVVNVDSFAPDVAVPEHRPAARAHPDRMNQDALCWSCASTVRKDEF